LGEVPMAGIARRNIARMKAGLPHGTVTFLFSDIEGSTELSRQYGAAFGELRAEHRRLLRESFEAHHGHEIDAEGDAFFIAFERATEAVAAAVAAQRALVAVGGLRVRMGLHTTDPHLHSDGYVGVGVSRAARICAAAHGGQIVLSQATAGIVEDDEHLARLRELGDHLLKDIPQPQRLYQLEAEGLPSDFPPLGIRTVAGTIATLLAIDLDGWRLVMRELGDEGAAAAAAEFHRIVNECARANEGVQVERVADWAMCVFTSPKAALLAVAAIHVELRNSDWIQVTEKPELAAAVHTGRVQRLAGGQLGSSAFRVGMLCRSAEPGQVLVSHSTHALLEGEVLGELELRDLGERDVRGLAPTRVYELINPSASS
jgi:class 3 adenylate cyclase